MKIETTSFNEFLENMEEYSKSRPSIYGTAIDLLRFTISRAIIDFDNFNTKDKVDLGFKLHTFRVILINDIEKGVIEIELGVDEIPKIVDGNLILKFSKKEFMEWIKEKYKGILFKRRYKR